MPTTSSLSKQNAVPMIYRRHGDTTPKPLNHALGGSKPASHYVHELERQGLDKLTTLENHAAGLTISKPFCPTFIANDKKVLCFGAYFLEAVHESNLENYRVRICEIFYYLEDQTLQITEPKVENSGILQGNFIKRHRIPKPESDPDGQLQYFTLQDLNVGKEITLYGRTFHIIRADPFTRQYLGSKNITVPLNEEPPQDAYTDARKIHMARETGHDPTANYGKKQYPMKEFMEARLGRLSRPADYLKNFLDHDRHVLRFYAIWDDTNQLYGMKHRYTIHFFLADNTIEILERYERNSGCDPFPKLLNRIKLSKDPKKQISAAVCDTDESCPSFYTWQDFSIGKMIPIYNRMILILDADPTTREWFIENQQPLENPIIVQDEKKKIPIFVPPPHNGIGSEEDSLQSCYHLLPKAPFKSIEQLNTKEILRFRAKFETTKPEDREREFILSMIVADQSIQIIEPVQRNNGFMGGKFLERTRIKDPTNGEYLGFQHMYVGAKVRISGRIFIIYEMDEYTAQYMESHCDVFIKANAIQIIQQLRCRVFNVQEWIDRIHALENTDIHSVHTLITTFLPDFTLHEVITIIRQWGKKESMTIDSDKLIKLMQ